MFGYPAMTGGLLTGYVENRSMSNLLWVAVTVILVVLAIFMLRRAGGTKPSGAAAKPGASVPASIVRIHAPQDALSCESVQQLRDQRYSRDETPSLPLTSCTMPDNCRCRYIASTERRRIPDRRSGQDRRADMRFEPDKPPRRQNHGRRKTDELWRK